VMGRSGVFM